VAKTRPSSYCSPPAGGCLSSKSGLSRAPAQSLQSINIKERVGRRILVQGQSKAQPQGSSLARGGLPGWAAR
jgi:hypothetical protein